MFPILSQYLFEFKKLALPAVGVWQLQHKDADTDRVGATISAPSWIVNFDANAVDQNDEHVVQWLAQQQGITVEAAKSNLEDFVSHTVLQLDNGASVDWPELGVLKKTDGAISFVPLDQHISPLTQVAAKKIIRDNTSHQTLVGDTETTTAEMRNQLQFPEETRSKTSIISWMIVGVAIVAAVWFFAQKGCSSSAAGNQQKIESTKSTDTYQIK